MKKGGIGGGNTATGLKFEGEADFIKVIKKQKGYTTKGSSIFYDQKEVALSFRKYKLYKYLEKNGIDYKKLISKRLLPDDAIYVIANNTFFILEHI